MYAEIENISLLRINFKLVPIDGSGFVIIKKPEKHTGVFSPNSEEDCFFLCLDEAKLSFREGITLHQIKQEEKIGSFVSIKKISKVITYLNTPIQVVFHNVKKDGTFPTYTNECSRIPLKYNGFRIQIHIGQIHVQYFLITDTNH